MNNSVLSERRMLVSLSLFSLFTIAVEVFKAFSKGDEEKTQKVKKSQSELQQQEKDISKQLDNFNHLQQLLTNKAEYFRTQLQIYYRFVCTFEEQIQLLIEKTQKDFVVFLNLNYSTATDSIDFHMCQAQNQFGPWIKEWSQQIKQQLKQKLHLYDQPVSITQIFEIVKFQIQCLIEQGHQLRKAITKLHLQSEDEQGLS